MKLIFRLFVLLLFQITYIGSVNAQPEEMQSNKLNLTVTTHDGNPSSWLQYYIPNIQRKIAINAEFNIKNVRAAIITDMYAVDKRCRDDQLENISFFAFDSEIGLGEFTTRINLPCIYKGSSKLKLRVVDKDNKRYFKTFTLPIHPNSTAAK